MAEERKSYAVHDEELDGVSLDEMAGMHPSGQFQAVLAQIAKFRAEYKDQNKQLCVDDFYVFCFETVDDTGVRRMIETRKMTGKPYSNKSTMGKLLSDWFSGAKPEELKVVVPVVSRLLERNAFLTVKHEPSANGSAVYASITACQGIPVIQGKPAAPDIFVTEAYVDYFDRHDDFQIINDPGTGKKIRFRPWKDRDAEQQATDNANAGAMSGAGDAPAASKSAKGAKPKF